MVLPAAAHLSTRVLSGIVAANGLGDLHRTLAPTAIWRPPGAPDPRDAETADALTRLGWRQRNGSLDREVAASLAVLCRPDAEFYGWLTHDDATTAVLAAATGREAVLAVRRPDATVWLSTIPAKRLAERLVAQLPEAVSADGASVTVALTDLHAANRNGQVRAQGGVIARRADPDVRHVQWLMSLPVTGAGELYAAVRDDNDTRLTHDEPVEYADTATGRVLATKPDPRHLRVGPGSRDDLVAELHRRSRRLAAE